MNLNFNTMKKSINIFLLISFLVTTLCSCEKEIDLNLNAKSPKLVVEGNILLGLDTLIQTQEIKLHSNTQ